jgi:hypothetical protein
MTTLTSATQLRSSKKMMTIACNEFKGNPNGQSPRTLGLVDRRRMIGGGKRVKHPKERK